jgi:hypothetical protein
MVGTKRFFVEQAAAKVLNNIHNGFFTFAFARNIFQAKEVQTAWSRPGFSAVPKAFGTFLVP